MAFKLTKAQEIERTKLISDASDALDELNQSIVQFNHVVGEQRSIVESLLSTYNEALLAMKAYAEERGQAWQAEFDEKSEGWQDGDRGEAVKGLISEWEEFDIEELEIEISSDIEEIEEDAITNFSELAAEAN